MTKYSLYQDFVETTTGNFMQKLYLKADDVVIAEFRGLAQDAPIREHAEFLVLSANAMGEQ